MSRNLRADFYWKDWRSDQCLALCSLAAQGLWMRMLCVMAEADPIGYFLIDGAQPSNVDLAKLVGSTEDEVTKLVDELGMRNVYSRNRAGIIYSRRMVRDQKKKKIARENGKTGGNPKLRKQREISPPDNQTLKPEVTQPLSLARAGPLLPPLPHNHITTPTTVDAGGSVKPIDRVCEALGVKLTAHQERLNWPGMLAQMLDRGLDLERDILPACVEAKKRRVVNLEWVRKRAEGQQANKAVQQQQATTVRDDEAHDWRMKFLESYALPVTDGDTGKVEGVPRRFVGGKWVNDGCWRWVKNTSGNGVWQDVLGVGPPPHDPRTLVTEDELARYPAAKAKRDELRARK
jgi:hypothetical protein